MQHEEGFFNGSNNLSLYYQCWQPRDDARAVVVLVHGFSDHCGRYDALVGALLRHHMAIYGYDLRGHGRSSGKRGHIDHFEDYREDTRTFIDFVHERLPDPPIFLYGHSMGGLISLDQALAYPEPLSGVIASAPLLGTPAVSPAKLWVARLLSRLWPSLSMDAGLDASAISRDVKVVHTYQEDPLVHGQGSVRLATELEDAMVETQAGAAHLQIPLLIYAGSEDHITSPEYSKRFYDNVQDADKTIIIYEGGYHESHNDIHNERVGIEVAQWIEAQLLKTSQQHAPQDSVDG
ncbi:MAG: lysophospholipase [Candidatus Promineifilaceae bacterium]|jgi:alpha-beta hydrolase superfamily lysophospholipase